MLGLRRNKNALKNWFQTPQKSYGEARVCIKIGQRTTDFFLKFPLLYLLRTRKLSIKRSGENSKYLRHFEFFHSGFARFQDKRVRI